MSIYESTKTNPKKQLEFYKDLSEQLQQENQKLKKQLEVGEDQYNDLVEEKEEIKNINDKLSSALNSAENKIDKMKKQIQELEEQLKTKHNGFMASVDESCDLAEEIQKYKEVIDKINVFLDNHDKNAGKLYYKYDNKYLLSEIKEDIRDILKEVE